MADTREVFPARPCPMRARLRRLAPSYTFTGCLLPQAYGQGDKAPDEDEYKVQASPTTPAKLLMLTQGMGGEEQRPYVGIANYKVAPFSTNSPVVMSSVFSFPRVRTLTLFASDSLSPTTSRNGTFCIACSRIFAFIFSLRESTSTPTPVARSCCATFSAYSTWRSAIGIIATCTGESHTGNAPA